MPEHMRMDMETQLGALASFLNKVNEEETT
jgi:hypothetical protein